MLKLKLECSYRIIEAIVEKIQFGNTTKYPGTLIDSYLVNNPTNLDNDMYEGLYKIQVPTSIRISKREFKELSKIVNDSTIKRILFLETFETHWSSIYTVYADDGTTPELDKIIKELESKTESTRH